jgi:hypothetical protein
MRLLLALVLLLGVSNAYGWTGYDAKVHAAFRAAHPCPATGKTHGACPGYVIDHIVPLCADGPDVVENMQWQKHRASLSKDKREAAYCECIRKKGKAACHLKL